MIGPIAPDNAKIIAKPIGVRRPTIAIPATASSPNDAIARVTNAAPTGVASWVKIAGNAIVRIGLKSSAMLVVDGLLNPP